MHIHDIIIAPLLTEKAINLATRDVYMFEVHRDANKRQIARTLQELYNVTIEKVGIVHKKGKTRRVGKRMITRTLPDKKIAIVTVKDGSIAVFPKA